MRTRPVRPPLRVLLAYRVRGRRPDPTYDAWLRRDIDGSWYPWRAEAPVQMVVALVLLGATLVGDAVGGPLPTSVLAGPWILAAVLAGMSVLRRSRERDRERAELFGERADPPPVAPTTAPTPRA